MNLVYPFSSDVSWLYVTKGAWEVCTGGERLEFILLVPKPDPIHIETLAMVVNMHADSRYRLGYGHRLRIGRSWVEDSKLDCLLITLPYPYGPDLEYCRVNDDFVVRFLMLVPISSTEYQFIGDHSVEELEDRLEMANVDFVDPFRPNVA